MHGDSRMFAPSDVRSEREAIAWATEGIVRVRDVLSGVRITSHIAFRGRHRDALDHTLIQAIRDGLAIN